MPGAGRRPGPTRTREEILDAARTQFADHGYAATTIRSIAAGARVNPALVHHYFATKDALFLAALQWPLDPVSVVTELLATGPRAQFPRNFARAFISAWRDPDTAPALQAVLRRAVADADNAALLRGLADSVLLPRIAEALTVPETNVAAAISHLLGLMLAATILNVAPLANADVDELTDLVTPAIEHYLRPSHG
jgi:AcrR family transcriptional regulator